MNDLREYHKTKNQGKKLIELLTNADLNKEYSETMNFSSRLSQIDNNSKKDFSGKLLMFTQNQKFEQHVSHIVKPLQISFPQKININDINGRIEYTEQLFKNL